MTFYVANNTFHLAKTIIVYVAKISFFVANMILYVTKITFLWSGSLFMWQWSVEDTWTYYYEGTHQSVSYLENSWIRLYGYRVSL